MMKPETTQSSASTSRPRATSLSGWPAMQPMRDGCWRPPTNVFETDSGAMVQVEVAGLSAGSFRVEVDERRLRVEGTRPAGAQLNGCVSCRQVEIAGGRFRSEVELPWAADGDRVMASYRDGFIFVQIVPARSSSGA